MGVGDINNNVLKGVLPQALARPRKQLSRPASVGTGCDV